MADKLKTPLNIQAADPVDTKDVVSKEYVDGELANKSDVGHNHDSRYSTTTQIIAWLDAKANATHDHDERYYTKALTNNLLAAKVDSSAFTSANLLSMIKSVDGAGTGLDADMLDGLHGSSFARAMTALTNGFVVVGNGDNTLRNSGYAVDGSPMGSANNMLPTSEAVSQAINGLISKATSGDRGYANLGDVLKLNWGKLANVALSQTWYSVSFLSPFTSFCGSIQVTIGMAAVVNGAIAPAVKNVSLTGFDVVGDHSQDASTGDIYWMAIGK